MNLISFLVFLRYLDKSSLSLSKKILTDAPHSVRNLAATNPSLPLLPGPTRISTFNFSL